MAGKKWWVKNGEAHRKFPARAIFHQQFFTLRIQSGETFPPSGKGKSARTAKANDSLRSAPTV
jgi:hypothetical protein